MRIARISSAAALAALLVLAPATIASAHDELVSSDPSPEQQLDVAPEQITLSFSADVMEAGAAIVVVDADGHDWVVGDPVVDYNEVSALLDVDMPDAGYEVRWRVVSSDGHPISGTIAFTVGDAEPLVRDTTNAEVLNDEASNTEAEATPEADLATEPSAAAAEKDQSTTEGAVPRALLIGGGAAIVAAAIFALISVNRRRARRVDTETTDA